MCSAHEVCQSPPGAGSPPHTQDLMSWPVGSQRWERGGGQGWLLTELCRAMRGVHSLTCVSHRTVCPCASAPAFCCRPAQPWGGTAPRVKQRSHWHGSTATASLTHPQESCCFKGGFTLAFTLPNLCLQRRLERYSCAYSLLQKYQQHNLSDFLVFLRDVF